MTSYANGTRVKIVDVDRHCFQGRELHPETTDIGSEGVVLGMIAERDEETVFYIYLVALFTMPGQEMEMPRVLQMVDYEIEAVQS